jgi:hypothetical protein
MSSTMKAQVTVGLTLAALSLLAVGARADVPGYEFMDFPDRMALVIGPSMTDAGHAPKAVISERSAAALTAGQQPLSGNQIVLFYHGQVYIVPDKPMENGQMASDMVKTKAQSSGSSTGK